MSLARSALVRGPAVVTWNSITMFTRTDVMVKLAPVFKSVETSKDGEIDKVKTDLLVKCAVTLWGAWESLSTLFPSALLNPQRGTSLYGASDLPLVITGRDGGQITVVNAQITKLANLYLGVDAELFQAEVEFTGLIAGGSNPEDSGSYFTTGTGQTFTQSAFAKTNYKRVRFTGAWGAVAGFTTITPQKGFQVAWDLKLIPVPVDGLGTLDMTIDQLIVTAKCIPIGPTLAQLKTGTYIESAHGTLQSANAADLTLTGSGGAPVIVLKNAALSETAVAFGAEPLRIGETAWNTTRGVSSGVATAVATAA